MNFEFNSDQAALLDAVAKVVARHAATPAQARRFQYSVGLAGDLADAGFFECARMEELGSVAAAAMVIEVAASPLCVELAGSAFVLPMLAAHVDVQGPCAVLWRGAESAPTRFLPMAGTLVRLGGDSVEFARLDEHSRHRVEAVDSIFAYPMGILKDAGTLQWTSVPALDASALCSAWRTGIAAEIVGCLHAGLRSVLDHVRDRRQFGRPLGSFQAIQHRLAECATAIEGARWLTLKAAHTGSDLDVLLALGQAQRVSTRVCYDLHQFMGAMGLTLEHPLHRWTYRAKALRAELGGADRQFIAAADKAWGGTRERAGRAAAGEPRMETES